MAAAQLHATQVTNDFYVHVSFSVDTMGHVVYCNPLVRAVQLGHRKNRAVKEGESQARPRARNST